MKRMRTKLGWAAWCLWTLGCGGESGAGPADGAATGGVEPTLDAVAPSADGPTDVGPEPTDAEPTGADLATPDAAVPPGCGPAGTPTPARPAGSLFVEASDTVLPGAVRAATRSFGRPVVVDLNADGHDDLVLMPAHDLDHPDGPEDSEKRVLLAQGDGTFRDGTAETSFDQIEGGLLVFGDVDDDADQDLYAGTIDGKALDGRGLWTNDGTGRFTYDGEAGITLPTLACGDRTCVPQQMGGTFADFDGDGVIDLYLGGWFWSDGVTDTRYNPPARDGLYVGLGDGRFRDVTERLGTQVHPRTGGGGLLGRAALGVTPGDWDNDGDLDVFVSNYGVGRPVGPFADRVLCEPPRYWDQDFLWRNDGQLDFTDVAEDLGVNATMRGPGDVLDEPPLVIGEECPEAVRGSYPSPIGSNSFTAQFADFDNDGDLDLVSGAIAHPDYVQSDPTGLFVNGGAPDFRFTEEARTRGLRYREDEKHPTFADLDLDGRLDLVITGFRNPAENTLDVYLQNADGRFERLSVADAGIDDQHQEGLVLLDVDDDGDLDVYIAEDDGPAKVFLNRSAETRRGVRVRLEANAPADATGARVTVAGPAGAQRRDVVGGSGHYNPQPSRWLHLGLGGDTCARDVEVRWPDGQVERWAEVSVGRHVLRQGQGAP